MAALALVGCTAPVADAAGAPEPTGSATPSTAPVPTPTPTRTADPGGCEHRTGLGFLQGGDDDGHWVFGIGQHGEPDLVDRGPSESARGTVAKDDEGDVLRLAVDPADLFVPTQE